MTSVPKRWDLTMKIDPMTIVYPGDPAFKMDTIADINKDGSSFKLCHFSMGNHTGTHIDYPRHVLSDGKTSEAYTIDDHIKNGYVIEVPRNMQTISLDFVSGYDNLSDKIVFFKTRNSEASKHAPYTENFVSLEPDAAKYLVEKGVAIVGIDYISVDSELAHDLPTHNTLLKKGVLIVENLELKQIPAGEYKSKRSANSIYHSNLK
jgi:arylformamidase